MNNFFDKKNNDYECINKCDEIFLVNGCLKSNIINLPISENEEPKSFVIDTIIVDTPCYCQSKIKIDFNINIIKGDGSKISKIVFQVFKIYDNENFKIPVGQNLLYINENLNTSMDLLNLSVYDNDICNGKKCRYILEAKI